MYCRFEVVLSAAGSELVGIFSPAVVGGVDGGRGESRQSACGKWDWASRNGGLGPLGKAAATYGATAISGRLFLMGSAILEVVAIWETKGWVSRRDKVVMAVGKYGGRRRKAVIDRSAREGIEEGGGGPEGWDG